MECPEKVNGQVTSYDSLNHHLSTFSSLLSAGGSRKRDMRLFRDPVCVIRRKSTENGIACVIFYSQNGSAQSRHRPSSERTNGIVDVTSLSLANW
jgi:hypothetical protein